MTRLEETVKTLLLILGLAFGLIAAWLWRLAPMDSAGLARREAGGSAAIGEKARMTRHDRRAQALRVRICERQIYGRNGRHAVAEKPRTDPRYARLRRSRTS